MIFFFLSLNFVICPIAISYSMGKIIKSVCVCQSVIVCVRLWALSWSHFLIDFHQSDTDVKTHKSKNEFLGGQYRTTLSSLFCPPPKKYILGQKVLKIHANIK